MSDLQSTLEALQLNNYISLVVAVVVGYDYLLMLSREIDYIWRRRWTWVSTLFILVRYVGLCWVMIDGLAGSTFVPGPVTVNVSTSNYRRQHRDEAWMFQGSVLLLISCWTFPVFISAADYMMILRVYSMWNRSRTVLFILLTIYVPQVIVALVLPAIYNVSDKYFIVTTVQVLDFSFCEGTFQNIPALLGMYIAVPRLVLTAVLLILVAMQTLQQLVGTYRAPKQWQLNRYIKRLASDGILYFLLNALYNVLSVFLSGPSSTASTSIVTVFLSVFTSSLLCIAMPRFIIGIRELYDRDLRGRREGIDTGFGVSSQPAASEVSAMSAIAFADVPQGEGQTDDPGAVQPEVIDVGEPGGVNQA